MENKYIKHLKDTIYDTPTNYKNSVDYYSGLLKDKIDEMKEFASDTFEIEVENVPGTMEFDPIVCRVCHAINPKIGLQRGDDFKELKFFELDYPNGIGTRYRFDDSIWITVNTDNTKYTTKSNVIRRCNNVLKYINSNGEIIEEPCVIDYAVKYSNVYYNDKLDIPQGTMVITAQNNANTKEILINDRFIFDSQVYKIKSKNDFLREKTYDRGGSALVRFEANYDVIAPDDDFELGIASMNKYKDVYNPNVEKNKRIIITPDVDYIIENEEVVFSCYFYDGYNKTDEVFEITNEGVQSSYYTFNVIDGNHYSIRNNKMDLSQIVKIKCKTGDYEKECNYQLRGLF